MSVLYKSLSSLSKIFWPAFFPFACLRTTFFYAAGLLYAKTISFVHKVEQGPSLYSTSSDHSSSCKMKRIKVGWTLVLLAALELLLIPTVRITICLSRYMY